MKKCTTPSRSTPLIQDWITIREAVNIAKKITHYRITESVFYRCALHRKLCLSIYFQSPIILKKLKLFEKKLKLRRVENSYTHKFCMLDRDCFLRGRNLIVSTEEESLSPMLRVIDTPLIGYEYVLVQRLLARSLGIPLPITGAIDINYGISVRLSGELFQVFEKSTWNDRIKQQLLRLPENIRPYIHNKISSQSINNHCCYKYFPIHDLPGDACFVIRYTEFEKLINMLVKGKANHPSTSRISTPLSRLFWLACKHNEAISPLIGQPYKLLSIFEQWASDDGITDHLSGDTLKTALERGLPSSISASTSQ